MPNHFLVSVITPCFNQGSYLPECLESLIGQSYQNWECIVMDDGSKDDSLQIAQQYASKDARIQWASQSNQGPSAARNHAIALTKGEFIMPLDADDYISPTFLENAVGILRNSPQIKLVYPRCWMFGSKVGEMELRDYSYIDLMHGNIITITSLYRRSDFQKTSGYDEKMRVGWEDWEFYLSLLSPQDQVQKIDDFLYYRQKPGSREQSIEAEQAIELRRYIFLKHKEIYNQYFEDSINLTYQVKMLEREVRHLRNRDLLTRIKRHLQRIFSKP